MELVISQRAEAAAGEAEPTKLPGPHNGKDRGSEELECILGLKLFQCRECTGKMTSETNETLESTAITNLYNTTMEYISANTTKIPMDFTDPLPIIISLVCIFLLIATCLIFVTLCKPAALDQSLYGPREFMPYHVEDASEPQLRLWKRLGSLRQSINSFRRSRPISQCQRTCPRQTPTTQDWSFFESTKM